MEVLLRLLPPRLGALQHVIEVKVYIKIRFDRRLGNRPFKPRRDGTWTSRVPITRNMLHQQRTEFWETAPQYDGLVETWNTLRVAVELSHHNDLPTAQAVLDSAGITIPS